MHRKNNTEIRMAHVICEVYKEKAYIVPESIIESMLVRLVV